MITAKQVLKNPGLIIKYKDMFKNVEIFKEPWYWVFEKHPYLYREFSDRLDEVGNWDIRDALGHDPTLALDFKDHLHKLDMTDISHAVRDAPALVLDFKDYLHKLDKIYVSWLLRECPELSLCIKYKDDPNKVEAAYYITFPHELINMNKEEKREMSKRIMELLREERV